MSTFFPYQLEWILDWGRFSLLNKARQIGASHTYAGAAVLWGMFGDTTTVVSVGEREAVEVLDKVGKHSEALARLGSEWAAPRGKPTATTVRLRSGGRIIALPSTSGGRSFSGNVLLDEFAYHQHPEKVWDGAGGTTTHGFKLRVMTTPNGVGNLWHQLWSDPAAHAGYRLHEVTIDQAIADGLRVDIADCWKRARGDPRVFDQLFRCKFLDNNLQYIPSEFLVDAVADYDPTELEGETYGGLDIGEERDRTTLVIVKKSDRFRLRHVESHGTTDDELIDRLVKKAFVTYGCRRLAGDATGLGIFPAKRLKRTWKQHFEPVVFTNQVKEELATGLYDVMSERDLVLCRSYRPDPDAEDEAALLRDDIRSVRRIVTAAGNVRYDAPRTRKGHADRAWGLMLAIHAGNQPMVADAYGSARRHRGRLFKPRA